MPREVVKKVILTDLCEHPAVKAWHELGPDRIQPRAIITLKEQQDERQKSAVYRLEGLGPGGAGIIAKRCRRAAAIVERTIYKEILPHLPMPILHFYGYVEEPKRAFCWLFLEDACGMEFSPCIEQHRILAARWLGAMHTLAADPAGAARLPDRGPAHYLGQLRSAYGAIIQSLNNPVLNRRNITTLKALLSQYEMLEAGWGDIDRLSHEIPRTLVHGDFVAKNMCVRGSQTGVDLLPFDWGNAGYGLMATDLAQSSPSSMRFSANPDIAAYWAGIRDFWPDIKVHDLERLANFGVLLRLLEAINWITEYLAYEWVQRPMSIIEVYASRLAKVSRAVGLGT